MLPEYWLFVGSEKKDWWLVPTQHGATEEVALNSLLSMVRGSDGDEYTGKKLPDPEGPLNLNDYLGV